MLDVGTWLKTYLEADPTLITLLGSASNIQDFYPTNPTMWPVLAWYISNSHDHATGFADDQSFSDHVVFEFNVYHNQETKTTAIDQRLDTLMHTKLFTRTYYFTFKEANTNRNRSVLRYSRSLTAADIT